MNTGLAQAKAPEYTGPVAVEETIFNLLTSINSGVRESRLLATSIEDKLIGPPPVGETSKQQEPQTIVDVLYLIQRTVYDTNDTLARVDNRIS